MYKKVDTSLNFVEREQEVIKFWKDNKIFEKSVESTEGGKEFSFYDGPPTANGKPHIGHILTRVMKDIIPRYKTMKGYHVLRKAGWDTHGLPVELEVEKTLGMDGKQDIERYGVEPFIKKCKESVFTYKSEWERMSGRVGYWADMDNPYVTYDDKYIESVWWSLKKIFDEGLIYKGHKVVPYCPRCGTALSSHEVAQGYKDVEEKSCIAKFEVEGEKNTYILAWTTTPWTLPSNVALCVGAEYDYVTVNSDGNKYIIAEALAEKFFENPEIEQRRKGAQLKGLRYKPLFDAYKREKQDCFYVVCDDYVTLSDGTGVVHIAPAFGEDDARVGRENNLPFVQLVGANGCFDSRMKQLDGVFCKDADKVIIRDLKERGLLFKELMYKHSYPYCWRCDTPLIYYARSTWFIKTTEIRDRLLKNNASVNWIPDSIGKGRMGNFLENVIDWGLSRERYWGTPLPIWVCEECGKARAIGSKEELKKLGKIKGDIELHKPYVDEVEIDCECGHKMKRVSEVIDCWYDSGSMPFAQYHYPFENKETFEKTFPADFISEAVDQTRGWFYTLLAVSTLLFDKAPFKNCIVLGHVNDKDGIKMSKHKGNVVDPWSVLDKQGADAVRWYFYTSSAPWLPSRFYGDAVSEAQRKYLGTLWNTYCFYILYAEIDKFDPTKYDLKKCKLTVMDKWMLSGLNSLVDTVDKCLNEYKITEAARALQDFADSLSNWYVRRCRRRFWASGEGEDKIAAFTALYTALETLSRLSAPFTPFMSESIYDNVVRSVNKNAAESVHLTDFPKADFKYVDKSLEEGMNIIIEAAELGRSARNAAKIKNRQPLSVMYLSGDGAQRLKKEKAAVRNQLTEILADEINVKKIELIDDASDLMTYEVKPQLKTVGPKYGKSVGAIREHLSLNGDKAANAVKGGGVYSFEVNGETVTLAESDMLISGVQRDGYSALAGKTVSVALDVSISEQLLQEGLMREIVSKVQNMRKDSGFDVTDRIMLCYDGGKDIDAVFEKYGDKIAAEVLADKVAKEGGGTEIDLGETKVAIAVKKL